MRRIEELDSLRGIAALSVLTHHFLLIFPFIEQDTYGKDLGLINIFKYTPLHILFGGHEAVLFFFGLSGFVLSLPYLSNNQTGYPIYLLKRITRIYIPYIIVVIVALFAREIYQAGVMVGFSNWFNGIQSLQVTGDLIKSHLLLVGYYRAAIDPVTWTLVHEMRISIIFPLIMFFVMRYNWKIVTAAGLVLSTVGLVLNSLMHIKYNTSYFLSLNYILLFMVGALIAKNRQQIKEWYVSLTNTRKALLLCIGIVACTYSWLFKNIKLIHILMTNEWAICLGVAIFMIFALFSSHASKFLLIKPIKFVGKISFSLFLCHAIVLFAMVNLLNGLLPIWIILVLAFAASIAVASIAYYVIEKPVGNLSKMISKINIQKQVTFQK